jgi:hypothetical protein
MRKLDRAREKEQRKDTELFLGSVSAFAAVGAAIATFKSASQYFAGIRQQVIDAAQQQCRATGGKV